MTVEQALRQLALEGVSKHQAARELGVNAKALNDYLREFGIEWPKTGKLQGKRPGTMPPRIGRSRERVERIESEHAMPLAELLGHYAQDGESRRAAAEILGIPYATFRHWPEVRATAWPGPGQSNAAKGLAGHPGRRTPAIIAAAKTNLAYARSRREPREQHA